MKGKKRFAYLLLAVCLLVTMLPLAAAAEETAQEAETLDFVLVLDCSGTMDSNDPTGLALTACKLFVDMLPVENARIAAVAIGYEDGSRGYAFSEDYKVEYNYRMVHNVVPLASTEKDAEKQNFKHAIDAVGEESGKQTPIAHGLAAAVDILSQNGATDENACIILLSDGALISANADESDRLLNQSTAVAKLHGWPMFCIELDYENKNLNRIKEGLHADELLNRICKDSGAGANARMRVDNAGDIVDAFLKIFETVTTGMEASDPESMNTNEEGVAAKPFSIHELASEINIVVYGGGIEKLKLVSEDVYENGKPLEYVITGNKDFGNVKATYEPGVYYCVKMIRPSAGNWKVLAYGDPNAEILVHESPVYDADLKMTTKPSRTGILHRDDTIEVEAYFSYQDQPLAAEKFYTNNPAKLEVYSGSSDKPFKVFDIDPTENGYRCKLPVGEIPSGEFSICTVVEYSKFRGGAKRSNQVMFESENMGLVVVDNGTTERKAYVNSTFDAVDLNTIFQNPDGDAITYELSSRPVEFAFEVSDSGYLTIKSGFVPGTHSVELQARDGDMTSPVTHSLSLEVIDRPMEQKKIKPVEVFTDRYGFQKDAPETIELDLNEYITDPDGVELEYTVHESEAEYFAVTQEGSKICITAVAEGEGTLSITANDKVSDLTFAIEVISGSGKAEFWAENWIWFALGGGLIALIIITIVFISKNTKVKGMWDFTFEEFNNEAVAERVSIGVLQVGRKKVFKFRALVDEVGRYADDPTGLLAHTPNYFTDQGACAIEFKGVPFGKGFIVQKIPSNSEAVSVEYMGKKVTGKVRVTTGYITFRLSAPGAFGTNDEMNITMRSK